MTHPVRLWIIEEVGPVWVSLHVPELKQLSEAQCQDVLTDLRQKETHKFYCCAAVKRVSRNINFYMS